MTGTLQSISLVLTLVFLTYVTLILVPYLRLKPRPEGDPQRFQWHAFIPCRDEQSVIGTTIERARLTFPDMHLWVIDDDSEDDTARIVAQHAGDDSFVHLVQRRAPNARTGKGAALNAAYAELNAWLAGPTDPERVVVVVIDADGEMASNALTAMSATDVFANPRVGAAQAVVKMKNRADRMPFPDGGRVRNSVGSWLLRLQDVEFRTVILAMQSLRSKTGTVGMGGNGQFTRLSVLNLINDKYGAPWHGSLLEDYELGLHVIFSGYENRQVHDTFVSQEALPSVRRLITQRARWAQGVMQCVKYLPDVLRSNQFNAAGALEALYYLLLPFIQIIGFVVFAAVFALNVFASLADPAVLQTWGHNAWGLGALLLVFGIGPFAVWGFVYKCRCEPEISWASAAGIGLSMWVFQLYVIASTFKGFFRLVRRKNGWAKTRRNADIVVSRSAAIES